MTKNNFSALDNEEASALVKWHMEQNQLDKALMMTKSLLDGKTVDDEIQLLAARLYAQLRLFEKAQQLFNQYIDKNPTASHVKFQLGMTLFDSEKTEEAIQTWSSILAEQPYNPPALFYLALAYLKQDNKEDAIRKLQTILTNIPTENLYFGKAKDLISGLERDPSFRGAANKVNSTKNHTPSAKDIYSIEH
jgi:tetratricopeptide (TPR) repeat protein